METGDRESSKDSGSSTASQLSSAASAKVQLPELLEPDPQREYQPGTPPGEASMWSARVAGARACDSKSRGLGDVAQDACGEGVEDGEGSPPMAFFGWDSSEDEAPMPCAVISELGSGPKHRHWAEELLEPRLPSTPLGMARRLGPRGATRRVPLAAEPSLPPAPRRRPPREGVGSGRHGLTRTMEFPGQARVSPAKEAAAAVLPTPLPPQGPRGSRRRPASATLGGRPSSQQATSGVQTGQACRSAVAGGVRQEAPSSGAAAARSSATTPQKRSVAAVAPGPGAVLLPQTCAPLQPLMRPMSPRFKPLTADLGHVERKPVAVA